MAKSGTLLTIQGGAVSLGNITLKASTVSSSFILVSNGSLTLDAGAALHLGAITVSGGKLIMEAGSLVSLGSASASGVRVAGGFFEMKGGEISGSAFNGVLISRGTFILNGGVIKENSGYGVSGTFTMKSGEISANEGGVSGVLTMSGGKITGNIAAGNGGGVSGALTMRGGEISRNRAGNGGGVYGTGPITLDGGIISGNKATNLGGYSGVFFTNVSGIRPSNLDDIVTGNTGGVGQHNWP